MSNRKLITILMADDGPDDQMLPRDALNDNNFINDFEPVDNA